MDTDAAQPPNEDPVQHKKSIGQVIEILQVVSSLEMQEKVPNFILLVIYEVTNLSSIYGMPMLIEKEDKVLVNYKVCLFLKTLCKLNKNFINRIFYAWQMYSITVLLANAPLKIFVGYSRNVLS